jgi:hypothetical protein
MAIKRIYIGQVGIDRLLEMTYWCFLNFGTEAYKYKDIDDNMRWRCDYIADNSMFDFYDQSDATYFSLVWVFDE